MKIKKIFDKSAKAVRLSTENGVGYIVKRTEFLYGLRKNPRREISYSEYSELIRLNEKQIAAQEAEYKNRPADAPRFIIFIENEKPELDDKTFTEGSIMMQTYMPEKVFIGKIDTIGERITAYFSDRDNSNYWIIRIKAGYTLEPDMLYCLYKKIYGEKDIKIWYTDHDIKNHQEEKLENTRHAYKTDFSLDFLCSWNYIGDVFCVNAATYGEKYALINMKPYEFLLEMVADGVQIGHVPKMLYSEVCYDKGFAQLPDDSKNEEALIYKIYINKYGNLLKDIRVYTDDTGIHRVCLEWIHDAKISVIIPNKDHIDDLYTCLQSLARQTILDKLEILIVENNSTEKATFDFYKWLELENSDMPEKKFDNELRNRLKGKLRILFWEAGFNFSAINNFAAAQATGEYVLLLNNDIELKNENCLEEMLSTAMRPDVGMVGAKLRFQDNTIQHAGVVVGLGGVAGHAFLGFDAQAEGYLNSIISSRRVSAVTAACMMVRKSIYDEVGGLDERYAVDFNDVDFCMKVAEKAMIIYQPLCEAWHYESKTRGNDKQTPEQVERFRGEINLFLEKWDKFLKNGDPYYNRNLTLALNDYSMGNPYQFD